ncbi:hypothetical protein BT69DRAFT_612911 [Atractiella rhizophila]|nr:hypothetical protein BT69DRAFT_612911 [Atractiella rhizophila]
MTRSYLPLLLPTISLLSSAIPPTSAAPGNGEWRFGSFLGGWGDGAPSSSSSGSTSALADGASSKNAANGPSGTTNNASVYAPGDVQVVVVGGEAGLVYS